jgi:hypothetical protein
MMERRKTPRRDWVVGKDDVGHAILEWKVEQRSRRPDDDPCARTYDLLKRLQVPELVLEDDRPRRLKDGLNPYDTGTFPVRKSSFTE